MFGSKKKKQDRLNKLAEILEDGQWYSQADLANKVGVQRSTILKDLPYLNDRGVYLEEDEQSRLRLSRWWRR